MPSRQPPEENGRSGVLLINLGTPDAPTATAVRRYLRQFLSDRRVVDLPRLVWLPILFGIVLFVRPRRAARAYASIWTEEGSPLLAISRRQRNALAARLAARSGFDRPVALGMRYGRPSIDEALAALERQGVSRLAVLPLYPQYSAATTAAGLDAVFDHLRRRWNMPELHTIHDYHLAPAYIDALAASVRDHWQAQGERRPLLMSFHGLPQRYVDRGDPYAEQCRATASRLAQVLDLRAGEWTLAFQSRFGAAAWLRPYTDVTLQEWAKAGMRRVDVICPGFSADCLETLEEISIRNREQFLAAGGEHLGYIPCLNDRPAHIELLADLCESALKT